MFVKPVMLPPGWAKLAANPLPSGSETAPNTIGIVCVSRARAVVSAVPRPRIASGRKSTNCFASVLSSSV